MKKLISSILVASMALTLAWTTCSAEEAVLTEGEIATKTEERLADKGMDAEAKKDALEIENTLYPEQKKQETPNLDKEEKQKPKKDSNASKEKITSHKKTGKMKKAMKVLKVVGPIGAAVMLNIACDHITQKRPQALSKNYIQCYKENYDTCKTVGTIYIYLLRVFKPDVNVIDESLNQNILNMAVKINSTCKLWAKRTCAKQHNKYLSAKKLAKVFNTVSTIKKVLEVIIKR